MDRNFVSESSRVPKIVSRAPQFAHGGGGGGGGRAVSESIYIPRAAVPFHLRRRRQSQTGRKSQSVCLSAAHLLSILQFKHAFLPPCLSCSRPALWQEPVWRYGSFLPSSSWRRRRRRLCHRNRHSPSLVSLHRSRIDGMASFPLSFSALSSLSLLRVYLWTKCANNNVNSHYHKERLASFGLSRPDSVTSFGGKLRDKRTCAFGFFVA